MTIVSDEHLGPGNTLDTRTERWRPFFANWVTDRSTSLAAVSAYEASVTTPGTNGALDVDADTVAVIDTSSANLAQFQFFGTDAEDETGAWRLWGVSGIHGPKANDTGTIVRDYNATLMAVGTLTLGAQACPASFGVDDAYWADTIVVTNTYATDSRGVLAFDTAGGGKSTLQCDMRGFSSLLLELTTSGSTAASLGGLSRKF